MGFGFYLGFVHNIKLSSDTVRVYLVLYSMVFWFYLDYFSCSQRSTIFQEKVLIIFLDIFCCRCRVKCQSKLFFLFSSVARKGSFNHWRKTSIFIGRQSQRQLHFGKFKTRSRYSLVHKRTAGNPFFFYCFSTKKGPKIEYN